MSKGYVVLAQNTDSINYIECAEALALSLKKFNKNASITLISDDEPSIDIFDNVVKLPYGDLAPNSDWKLINDWQVYEASPYVYTIKLEADLFIPKNLDYYFELLQHQHVSVCNTILDYKGNVSDVTWYRNFIVDNKLPNVYNAITYFDKSEFSQKFFKIVRNVFENWDEYRNNLMCNNSEKVTTDWAYSIACHIMGVENTTHKNGFKMVHMKQFINNLSIEDWTQELIYEIDDTLRIHTLTQSEPFHYHIKSFSSKIKEAYA